MLIHHKKPILSAPVGFTAATTVFLLLAGFPCLHAQDSQSAEAAEAAPKIVPLESRLISDSEIDDFLASMAAMLAIAARERDPFGAMQDPDAVPKIDPITMPDMPVMPVMSTPFEDVVRQININTVIPAEKRFLIGNRSFRVNDELTINFRGQPVRAKVEAVSSREIRFRNVENNDVAVRKLEMLPPGMSAGGSGGGQAVLGLAPASSDAPIDLD